VLTHIHEDALAIPVDHPQPLHLLRLERGVGERIEPAGLVRMIIRAHDLCGRAALGLAPHTTMCMGEKSFTEENRSPLHVWTYISLVDVTV
jgi:hypothetical protein